MSEDRLLLRDYHPRSQLKVQERHLHRPKFPAIDFHAHFADFYCPLYAGNGLWAPPDIPLVVETLREQGIRRIVNLDGFWDGFFGLSQEKILDIFQRWGDFFTTFVSINTDLAREPGFEKYVRNHLCRARELGARGVKLFKHVSIMRQQPDGTYAPGRNLLIDDERLGVIWATAAELKFPVLAHIADPTAFFEPVDERNERYLELRAHPDWSFHEKTYTFGELMEAQCNLLARNPDTTFVIPHVGSHAEDLAFVSDCLRRYPNLYVDIAARIDELGRQPYTARAFFLDHPDRILFGTDAFTETVGWLYKSYFRFLETYDEYFPCGNFHAYGIGLPDDVLEKVYCKNALRVLGETGMG